MELFSTVIHLQARQRNSNFGFSGRQVQAWFLREIRRHDPTFAKKLHDDDMPDQGKKQSLRPYTLSPLYKGPHIAYKLEKDDWCWFRITSLRTDLSDLLSDTVLPNLLGVALIHPVEFTVRKWSLEVSLNPDRKKDSLEYLQKTWAETYEALQTRAKKSRESKLEFKFTSTTSFNKKGIYSKVDKDVPLPIPSMVFGSYFSRWSAYSGIALPKDIGRFIDECVVINELDINSHRTELDIKNVNKAATGFTGIVLFTILGDKAGNPYLPKWREYADFVGALARYSFYCGTGRHTTIGLGQTRFMNPDR